MTEQTPANETTPPLKLTPMRAPWLPPEVEEPTTGPTDHPLVFSGNASEFFRIWIVNVGLSIITLGIYAAWAKVRTKRYFYANTTLDGAPFDYLAKPGAILTGNIIGLVLLSAYTFSSGLNPLLGLAVALMFMLVVPWVVTRSLKFRANNAAWRNIRFGFDGGYWDAAFAYILAPITIAITSGLSIPWADWVRRRLQFRHARFGTTPFEIGSLTGKFYKIYLIALIGFVVIGYFSFALLAGVFTVAQAALENPGIELWQVSPVVTLLLAILMAFVLLIGAFIKARITNLMWNHTTLGAHRFRCNIKVLKLAWIYVSNTVAIAASVGLAIPWAKVRALRYQLSCMTVVAASNLSAFAADARDAQSKSAIGEELGDAMGLDIGL